MRNKVCYWALFLVLVIVITGCTRSRPYRLNDPAQPPNLSTAAASDSNASTASTTPQKVVPAPVVTIEFDDQGKVFPCATNPMCQVDRATAFIQKARAQKSGRNLVVLTFVHGWHHNASNASENFRNFHVLIDCLNLGSRAQPVNVRRGQPVECGGLQPDPSNFYIGVYIGWRGESVQPWLTEGATALSLANRHAAAVQIASNTTSEGMEQLLLKLSSAAKMGDDPARFILIGHSFGGLIVGRIANDLFYRRVLLEEGRVKDLNASPTCIGQFADLVVLLNPADSGIRLATLAAEWKRIGPCRDARVNSSLSRPFIVSLHTSSDSVTDALGSKVLSHTSYDRDYAAAVSAHWNNRPDSSNPVDIRLPNGTTVPLDVEAFRGSTVNFQPYLRNLCYLDQANRQDPICLGLNDSLRKMKVDVWKSELAPSLPQLLNPNYSADPYYHGSYELLTAVCFEPWEARGKAKNKKHEFDPDFASKPCTPETRLKRASLRAALEKRLGSYLAFPTPQGPFGDVLLDVYARMYSGCYRSVDVEDAYGANSPEDCAGQASRSNKYLQTDQSAWNNTPVWLLNTSYEIVQEHSGFWNADAATLLIALASQFKTVSYDANYNSLPPLPPDVPSSTYQAPAHPAKQQRSAQQAQQQQQKR